VRLGAAIAVTPAGQFIPVPGARLGAGHRRIVNAVNGGIWRRGGPWWPELAPLPPEERPVVQAYVTGMLVWNAAAPRFTVDGRRVS
jgi:hypothetical protein